MTYLLSNHGGQLVLRSVDSAEGLIEPKKTSFVLLRNGQDLVLRTEDVVLEAA